MMITQLQLKELVTYNPDTGYFTWKVNQGCAHKGTRAGTVSNGRACLWVNNKKYTSSRMAWLYMTGSIPQFVDHINRDPCDDRFSNLRAVTRQQNNANTTLRKDNTSGYKGVHKQGTKFVAQMRVGNTKISLGTHATAKLAAKAYKVATDEWFGSFNNVIEEK